MATEHTTRRAFMKTAGMSAAAFAGTAAAQNIPKSIAGQARLNLGMASYTFREFDVDTTVEMMNRLDLDRIALKSFHLAMDSTEAQIRTVAKKFRDAGIEPYGCGVVYMKNENQVHQAFDYAKTAGMTTIVGVPTHELLPLVEKKVMEYDIKLAIHNHGPGDERYPSPQSAYEKIRDMDPRMGLCIDIGHTQRIGIDPCVPMEKYVKRVHDIHVKDVSASNAEGGTVEIGRGVIDIPKFLRTVIRLNYTGAVSLEFEKDGKDPLAGVAESIGYLRGALTVL